MNSANVRKRILQGISANFIAQLINFASRFLLARLFLNAWGVGIYGEWLILTSVSAYVGLTDFGGQLFIVNRLTQLHASGQTIEFRRILHTGMALYLIFPGLLYLLLVCVLPWLDSSSIGIIIADKRDVLVVLLLLSFQIVVSLPQGLIIGVYQAVGQLPRGAMLANFAQLLQLLFISAALSFRVGMIGVAILQIIPYFVVISFALVDLSRLFPQCEITSLKSADSRLVREFIKPSLHFFLLQISQLLNVQGIIFIVGALFGGVQVVLFSTTRTLVGIIRQFLGVLTHSAWPEMTRLDVEDKDMLFRLFRKIIRSTLYAALGFSIVLHYGGEYIYDMWLGDKILYGPRLTDLFLLYLMQSVFWSTCSHLLMATNNHYVLSRLLGISSILSMLLAFWGGKLFGIDGVLYGMIAADLFLPAWIVPCLMSSYDSRYSLRFFFSEAIPVIGMAILIFVIPMPW